jgi:hypothetical protein
MQLLVLLSQVHHLLLNFCWHANLLLTVFNLGNVVFCILQKALQLTNHKIESVDFFQKHNAPEMQLAVFESQRIILQRSLASLKAELALNSLIFSSKKVDSVFDFRRDSEFDLLFDFGFDSSRAVLDFEDGSVESLVLLSEL